MRVPARDVSRSISKGVSGQFDWPLSAPKCARFGPVATRSRVPARRCKGSVVCALPEKWNSPKSASSTSCAISSRSARSSRISTGPSSMSGSDKLASKSFALSAWSVAMTSEFRHSLSGARNPAMSKVALPIWPRQSTRQGPGVNNDVTPSNESSVSNTRPFIVPALDSLTASPVDVPSS